MTQKYNLRKYERAAKLILNAVGVSPEQLGFLEKIIKLEEDKSHVRQIRVSLVHPLMVQGFKIDRFPRNEYKCRTADVYLKNLHLLIDINVNSEEFAYKDYVKNYLKKKKIPLKLGNSYLNTMHTYNFYVDDYRKVPGVCKKVHRYKYSIIQGKLYQKENVIYRGWSFIQGKEISYKTNPVTFFSPYKGITVSVSKSKRDKDGAFPHNR
jgi:hypothetical protein